MNYDSGDPPQPCIDLQAGLGLYFSRVMVHIGWHASALQVIGPDKDRLCT